MSASPIGSKPGTRNAAPPEPLATSCRTHMGPRGILVLLLAAAKGAWQEVQTDAAAAAVIGDIVMIGEH